MGSFEAQWGWLASVVPSGAGAFDVAFPDLREALASDGAPTSGAADVEIVPPRRIRGAAPTVIVPLRAPEPRSRLRAARGVARVERALRLRLQVAWTRARLRRSGHAPRVVWLQHGEPLLLAGGGTAAPRAAAHRLPLAAVVVGSRGPRRPTVLERAIETGGAALGAPLRERRVLVGSSGVLLVVAPAGVLHLGVADARRGLAAQADAVELVAAAADPLLSPRVPRLLARGTIDHADWTILSRVAGVSPTPPVGGALLDDCVEFLAALHRLRGGPAGGGLLESGELLAAREEPAVGARLRAVAAAAAERCAPLPLGFGHGDFWSGNLLVRDGRLAGVVDWAAAGSGRLPLLDLIHLLLSDRRERRLGPAFLAVLWPLGQGEHRHPAIDAYCRRRGLALDGDTFRALLVAYWLGAVARDLGDTADPEDALRPAWRRENVLEVLAAVEPALLPAPVAGAAA